MPATQQLRQSDATIGIVDDSTLSVNARDLLSTDARIRAQVVMKIGKACRETGFFYISKIEEHAIALAPVLRQMQIFFDLSDDNAIKTNAMRGADGLGWIPQNHEPAYQPDTISHLEAFDCGLESVVGTHGDSKWPDLAGMRGDVSDCWHQFESLGQTTLALISAAIGLDNDFLPSRCQSAELNTLRLLHYPKTDLPPTPHDVGIAAHTDFECITFIYQTAPGLELTNPRGEWFDAPSHDGRIIVILGDMLQRWTNGMLKATGHRVRNTPEQRFSVVMFVAADSGQMISPLSKFVSRENPCRYPPVGQAEHIEAEIARAEKNTQAIATKQR